MCFVLRAQLLIRNMTEQSYGLHSVAGMLTAVQPMTNMAANWWPSQERPDHFSITMYTSSGGSQVWTSLAHAFARTAEDAYYLPLPCTL